LERFTPMQIGMAMTAVIVLFLVTNAGNGGMRRIAPAALPVASEVIGNSAPAGTSATLPLKREPVGMPSVAAGRALLAERSHSTKAGGGAGCDAPKKLRGIPSMAAGRSLSCETLPMTRDDGFTLPPGAGDNHAEDAHYSTATLPLERAIEHPTLTPAEAAMQAEQAASMSTVDGGGGPPVDPNQPF
jgi:hypothetical protein